VISRPPIGIPVLVLAATLFAVVGCGNDDSSERPPGVVDSESPSGTSSDDVKEVMKEFLARMDDAQRDDVKYEENSPVGAKVCEMLVDPGGVVAPGGDTCAARILSLAATRSADYAQPMFGEAIVTGDSATVTASFPYEDDPYESVTYDFKLRRVSGTWKVIDPNP
jgi:hypothetical protein